MASSLKMSTAPERDVHFQEIALMTLAGFSEHFPSKNGTFFGLQKRIVLDWFGLVWPSGLAWPPLASLGLSLASPWPPLGLPLASLWPPLASPWPPFGASVASLWPPWPPFGLPLASLWPLWDPSWPPLASFWPLLASPGLPLTSFGRLLASLSGFSGLPWHLWSQLASLKAMQGRAGQGKAR